MVCDSTCLIESILFCFGAVSLPLYLVFLTTLVKYRNFELKGPFYTLVLSLGVADVIAGVSGYTLTKFRVWGWFAGFYLAFDQPLAYTAEFFSWATPIGQSFGVTLVSLNRVSAILYPLRYAALWTGGNLIPVCLAAKWLGAACLGAAASLPLTSVVFVPQNDSTYMPTYIDAEIYRSFVLLFAVVSTATVLTSVAYVCMFVKLYRRNRTVGQSANAGRQASTNQKQKDTRMELNLALTGFVLFSVMFLWCAFVAHVISADGDFGPYYIFWAIVTDVFTWINPYLFLICSSKIRYCFRKVVWCQTENEVIVLE